MFGLVPSSNKSDSCKTTGDRALWCNVSGLVLVITAVVMMMMMMMMMTTMMMMMMMMMMVLVVNDNRFPSCVGVCRLGLQVAHGCSFFGVWGSRPPAPNGPKP